MQEEAVGQSTRHQRASSCLFHYLTSVCQLHWLFTDARMRDPENFADPDVYPIPHGASLQAHGTIAHER